MVHPSTQVKTCMLLNGRNICTFFLGLVGDSPLRHRSLKVNKKGKWNWSGDPNFLEGNTIYINSQLMCNKMFAKV